MTSQPSEGSYELVDYKHAFRVVTFVAHAAKRHRMVFASLFIVGLAVTGLIAVFAPRTYYVFSTILAQRNQVMAGLTNPGRSIPHETEDAPMRAAAETVLKRDNIVALVKQTNLIDEWDSTRAPILQIKDAILRRIKGEPSAEDRLESLVGLLGERLVVKAENGTVTIELHWGDPVFAYRIVQAAQENFLESRHVSEVSSIAETITILEGHASSVRDGIEQYVADLNKRSKPAPTSAGSTPSAASLVKKKSINPDDERDLQRVKVMWQAKKKAIEELEDFRRRRLTELDSELAIKSTSLAEAHPVIQNIKKSIEMLKSDSPQLVSLRQQEGELREELRKMGERVGADPSGTISPAPRAPMPLAIATGDSKSAGESALEDDAVGFRRARLRIAMQAYEDLVERIEAARLELDTARAGFKYRYSIVTPPQEPTDPIKPRMAVVLPAGLILSLLLAFAGVTLVDAWSRRVIEAWQVERYLGVPVLTELTED